MHEPLTRGDTGRISSDSVKPKLFTDVNRSRSNLNPNSPKF